MKGSGWAFFLSFFNSTGGKTYADFLQRHRGVGQECVCVSSRNGLSVDEVRTSFVGWSQLGHVLSTCLGRRVECHTSDSYTGQLTDVTHRPHNAGSTLSVGLAPCCGLSELARRGSQTVTARTARTHVLRDCPTAKVRATTKRPLVRFDFHKLLVTRQRRSIHTRNRHTTHTLADCHSLRIWGFHSFQCANF